MLLHQVAQAITDAPGMRLSEIMVRVGERDDRVVDRVLQKLRRQGVIKFDSKTGWHPVSQ